MSWIIPYVNIICNIIIEGEKEVLTKEQNCYILIKKSRGAVAPREGTALTNPSVSGANVMKMIGI